MVEVGAAPGRVNLIGEHTDYNGGFVLPTVLPQQTRCEVVPRSDQEIHAFSAQFSEDARAAYTLGSEQRRNAWIDYVQGVTWALQRAGIKLRGFDLSVQSEVPIGKGLSSSASLEVAVLRALRRAFGISLSDVEMAQVAHEAETGFVGAPVGIMDQMVCSLGREHHALFLDTRTRTYDHVPIPDNVEIAVIDSGLAHHHASGSYRERRRECDEAAAQLGVEFLCDLKPDDFPRAAALPDPLNRRVRHVVSENRRVLAAVDALRRRDTTTLGALFRESHASMRDDFEVSLPEIDQLVALADRHPGVLGARLTGGGFGGAVVMLCTSGFVRRAAEEIVRLYRSSTHCDGSVLLPRN